MLQLRLQLKAEAVDAIEHFLFECGAISVSLEDGGTNPILEPKLGEYPLWPQVYLRALFIDQDRLALTIKALENEAAIGGQIVSEQIDDHGWQEKFQQQFDTVQYGSRLWVYPSWHQNPDPEGTTLQLDPGLAFGTGQHPTTDLCLQWLCHADLKESTVIDFGCGSGILALAAVKLGANQVYAIDIDPQALQATSHNAARNKITHNEIKVGDIDILQNVRADIIVANILAGPLCELRATFLNHLNSGATLVLSGILAAQTEVITKHYVNQFEHVHQSNLREWACLTLRRRD